MFTETQFCLDIEYQALAPYECLAVSTVLSRYQISLLLMNESHIGDDGVSEMFL